MIKKIFSYENMYILSEQGSMISKLMKTSFLQLSDIIFI